jgi:hypothetical protein
MSRHYRVLAGNLELFVGAYFVGFGFLAVLFFIRFPNPMGMWLAAAAIPLGWVLIWRAAHLLAWRRWVYWLVVALAVGVPVAWLLPAVISYHSLFER